MHVDLVNVSRQNRCYTEDEDFDEAQNLFTTWCVHWSRIHTLKHNGDEHFFEYFPQKGEKVRGRDFSRPIFSEPDLGTREKDRFQVVGWV